MSEPLFELISWKGEKSGPFSIAQIQEKWDAEELSGLHQVIVEGDKPLVKDFLDQCNKAFEKERVIAEQQRQFESEQERIVALEEAKRIENKKIVPAPLIENHSQIKKDEYYIHVDNVRKGPFSKDNLQIMYRAGKISDSTQVWTEDLGDWVSLRGFKEIIGDIQNGRILDPYKYAGFWVRLGAVILDCLLTLLITGPILTLFYGDSYWYSEKILGPLDILLSWIFPFVATLLFWAFFQATPGKLALGIKIVNANDGSKPSAGQLFGRYFAYILSSLPLVLGFLWVGISKRKQGWHDLLAGTIVIYK